jgi:hypothetical protein
MGKGHDIPPTFARSLYNSSHLIRYLNINRGLSAALHKLTSPKENSKGHDPSEAGGNLSPDQMNLLTSFGENSFFLYEERNLDDALINNFRNRVIRINHKRKPFNFGFDGHWNNNGRLNCAESAVEFMILHKNQLENNQ